MPIKIHHGPPGSYKTAGAMGDDFLREAKSGRVIVTNVRGVTADRVRDEFPDLPDSFDVIHVDDKTTEGREKWAKWFHWMPKGAFIFVDEIQMIWPKNWRESDIRRLDYPGGIEQATADDRPATWEEAFEKHRHYNWDMVFTTPSYKKVRDDVRQCAEMAFKHKNLAVVGIRGRYIEAMHLADDDGGSPSHFMSVNTKKVPAYVFRIYDSTATGAVTDSKTGLSIFQNPRVLFLLLVLTGCVLFVLSRPLPSVLGGGSPPPETPGAVAAAPSGSVNPETRVNVIDRSGPESVYPDARLEPFVEQPAFITMSVFSQKNGWRYAVQMGDKMFTSVDLLDMGYQLTFLGNCALKIAKDGFQRVLICGVPPKRNASAASEA
jgi:zona occludens toxin